MRGAQDLSQAVSALMPASGPLMAASLEVAVPLWQERVASLSADERLAKVGDISQMLAEKGDVLQYGGGKRGEAAACFNALAEGLAILSYCPGGVTFLGQHWEAAEGASRQHQGSERSTGDSLVEPDQASMSASGATASTRPAVTWEKFKLRGGWRWDGRIEGYDGWVLRVLTLHGLEWEVHEVRDGVMHLVASGSRMRVPVLQKEYVGKREAISLWMQHLRSLGVEIPGEWVRGD